MGNIATTMSKLIAFGRTLRRRRSLMFVIACLWVCSSCESLMAADPWPGESWNSSSNLTFLGPASATNWSSNLSGAYWNPLTRRLWLADNSGVFSELKENGTGGFTNERNYYVSPGIPDPLPDLEGITQASDTNYVYLLVEQANMIREYAVSSGVTNRYWNLTPLVGNVGNNGAEGIAFIPDPWLAASGFRDGNGNLYTQSVYGVNGLGGIMLVAVQHFAIATTGSVYAVDLNKKTNDVWTTVGKYKTSSCGDSCDLAFDTSIGRLYILHNSANASPQVNILEVTDLTSSSYGADRKFTTLDEFEVPSTKNIEGFAITPALTDDSTLGDGWCFFTNDDGNGDALRWFRQLPSPILINTGNNQSAPVSTAVPVTPSVMVRDAFKNPLPNVAVTFAVTAGDGSITGGSATTDPSGIAAVGSWTLGIDYGANTLSASGAGLSGSPINFNAAGTDPTRTNTLAISGPAYGGSSPACGIYTNQSWTLFTVAVTNSPVSGGVGTQYVCQGWTGSGSVPSDGVTTNTGLRYLTNETMITWLWATNYWLSALTNGYGTVSGTCGWVIAGSNVTLLATTNLYSYFVGWSGDIGPPNTGDVSYAVTMDRPRTLIANFADYLATNDTPWHWLAHYYPTTNDFDAAALSDTDVDGMKAWQEYRARTNPTNKLSLLKITGLQAVTNENNVSWSSVTGRTYSVYMSTNLVEGWQSQPLTSNVPADTSGTTRLQSQASTNSAVFYRISVE